VGAIVQANTTGRPADANAGRPKNVETLTRLYHTYVEQADGEIHHYEKNHFSPHMSTWVVSAAQHNLRAAKIAKDEIHDDVLAKTAAEKAMRQFYRASTLTFPPRQVGQEKEDYCAYASSVAEEFGLEAIFNDMIKTSSLMRS
jgi:hypothetical protein